MGDSEVAVILHAMNEQKIDLEYFDTLLQQLREV